LKTETLIVDFLAECAVRGLSAKTVEQYRWALARLGKDCPTLPCTEGQVLTVVGDPALRLESRRDVLKSLRVFFSWVERRHGFPTPAMGYNHCPNDGTCQEC
jgi:hypothetical protein